jgi:hypothetical protein
MRSLDDKKSLTDQIGLQNKFDKVKVNSKLFKCFSASLIKWLLPSTDSF